MSKRKSRKIQRVVTLMLAAMTFGYPAISFAALSVDHSRLIFNEGEKAVSVTVHNQNNQLPYLAQAWMEDSTGKKIAQPLTALPPIQRVEAGSKTAVRVQTTGNLGELPSDRESVFYFNLREVPPRSEKKNSLQLALQTRLKVFYRPKQLEVDGSALTVPGIMGLTITQKNGVYQIENPTPYFITVVSAKKSQSGGNLDKFEPFMIAPKETTSVKWDKDAFAHSGVFSIINDYGANVEVYFDCKDPSLCKVSKISGSMGLADK